MKLKYSLRILSAITAFATLFALTTTGCKDNAPDPGYVDYAELRVMEFIQGTPVQVFMYPTNNPSDTVLSTPTALTYGVSTVYRNNLGTARGAGQAYHLVAIVGGTSNPAVVLAQTDVTLLPGDKKTWIIYDKGPGDQNPPNAIFSDNPKTAGTIQYAYFRFANVTPPNWPITGTPTPNLSKINCTVGDPWQGKAITPAGGVPFQTVTDYVGIPVSSDTTITLYVSDGTTPVPVILGRLAGVALQGGTYHTITWGGLLNNDERKTDANGNHVLDDTIRIHIFDDNQLGNDQLPVPQTLRFNVINGLLPPRFHTAGIVDYTQSGGLALVINNNTSYDATNIQPYTTYPSGSVNNGVNFVTPKAIPLTGLAYVKCVSPYPGSKNPSTADSILFRFYGATQKIVSDQLVSFVIFDTVKTNKWSTTSPGNAAPYDSAANVVTVSVTDQPDLGGGATIVVVNALNGYKVTSTTLSATITVNSTSTGKKAPKTYVTVVQPAGTVNLSATWDTNNAGSASGSFNAEAGGIYEVILCGDYKRPDGQYAPHFMVVRTNPKN